MSEKQFWVLARLLKIYFKLNYVNLLVLLQITKQNNDYHHLSEMIFGSVAMSFRGTYMKIHSLNSPSRLMFTQVFFLRTLGVFD